MKDKEHQIESKDLLWFNHGLEGFYICSYDMKGFQLLFDNINQFKENHYSILLSLLEAKGNANMAI